MYKKFSIILLILLIATTISALPVFAETPTEINTDVQKISPEKIKKANNEHMKRYSEILKALEKQNSNNNSKSKDDVGIQWSYEEEKILNVPHHIQETSYWCGPTSILQIIDYNGREGSVNGSSEYDKQETLANESGTTTQGANTYYLKETLNDYISDIHKYYVTDIQDNDYDKLWNIVDNNIFLEDQPVLALVNTEYLPYYDGYKTYHYVVVDGLTKVIDDSTSQPVKSASKVRIVDPNYKSSYTGTHTVYFNDLFNALKGYYESSTTQAYNISY